MEFIIRRDFRTLEEIEDSAEEKDRVQFEHQFEKRQRD